MLEALAAVMVPSFENAGLSEANLVGSPLEGPSSCFTSSGSPLRCGTLTASISASNIPSFWAASARRKLSFEKSSCCSRVNLYSAAHLSPQVPMWTFEYGSHRPSKIIPSTILPSPMR